MYLSEPTEFLIRILDWRLKLARIAVSTFLQFALEPIAARHAYEQQRQVAYAAADFQVSN
jgi:hypothetical protein